MRDDRFIISFLIIILIVLILGFGMFYKNKQDEVENDLKTFIDDSTKYSIEFTHYDGKDVVKIESFRELLGPEKYQIIQDAINSANGNFAEYTYYNDNYSFELFEINNEIYTTALSFQPLYMNEFTHCVHKDSNILLFLEDDDFRTIFKYI